MFALFKSVRRPVGSTALYLHKHGVSLVRVAQTPGAQPRLLLCEQHKLTNQQQAESIIAALSRKYQLDKAQCKVLLDHGYKTVVLNAPTEVPQNELKEALRWQVQDIVDMPANAITLDYYSVAAVNGAESDQRINVVVAENIAIEETVELLHKKSVDIDIIDIAEMAQFNVAKLLPENSDGVAVLSMHNNGGLITISKNNELYLTRQLTCGSNNSSSTLDQLLLEVQRSLDFYESHFKQPAIHKVYVMLPNEEWPNFIQASSDYLGLDVEALDLTSLLDVYCDVEGAWQAENFFVIGAALRQAETMQSINLYQAPIRHERQHLDAANIVKYNLASFFVMVCFASFLGWQVHEKKLALETLTTEKEHALSQQALLVTKLQSLKSDINQTSALTDAAKSTTEKQQKLQQTLTSLGSNANRDSYSEILVSLARQITPGVWLTNVTIEQEGGFLQIEGEALQINSLTTYFQRLKQESALQGKEFEVFQVAQQTLPKTGASAESMKFILATHKSEGAK